MVDDTKSRAVDRPKRVPLHKQKTLQAKDRPGYMRRYVNEDAGRVEAFLQAGWSLVGGDNDLSDNKAQKESQLGSVNRKVVNKDPRASTQTAVLMEVPIEWYNEDQKAKQQEVDRKEASYNPDKFKQGSMDYGNMKKEYK